MTCGGIQSNSDTVAGSVLLRRRAGHASPRWSVRQSYRRRYGRFCSFDGQGVFLARWAALGCDATSRQQSKTSAKGRGPFCVDAERAWAVAGFLNGPAAATPTTTKGETARQPSPRWFSSSSSFRVIKPSRKQGVTVFPVLFRDLQKAGAIIPIFGRRPAPHGNQYVTQSLRKIGVCAFHRLGSINHPVPEVIQQ